MAGDSWYNQWFRKNVGRVQIEEFRERKSVAKTKHYYKLWEEEKDLEKKKRKVVKKKKCDRGRGQGRKEQQEL